MPFSFLTHHLDVDKKSGNHLQKTKYTTVGPLTLTLWQSSPFLPVTAFGSFFFCSNLQSKLLGFGFATDSLALMFWDALSNIQSSVSGLRLIKEMVQLVRQKNEVKK